MSQGAFIRSKYECDDGTIAVIRIQPETAALTIGGIANAAPTGTVNAKLRVRSSKGKREYGLGARMVTFEWTGALPSGYKADGILRLPILQQSVWDGINELDAGEYLGQTIQVVSKSPEAVK